MIFNAAVLVISGALTLEKVGISDFLISNVTPLVSGMNQTIFILVIATLCIIPLKDALLRDTQMVILNQKEIPPHVRSFYHYVKTQNLA